MLTTPLNSIEPGHVDPGGTPAPQAGDDSGADSWSTATPMALIRGPVVIGYLVVLLFFVGLILVRALLR